ncbi:MAG: sigma factor-like helix-turn-helix DNA-binding protein [Promethearchaeia archaeon]
MPTNALTNRKYLNGGVGSCIANRGTGKTLAFVIIIWTELMRDPTLEVYSNVHLNMPRCHYSPSLFLPFDELKNVIVFVDDCSKLENISRYAKIVSNAIRKIHGDIIFTGQDPKHVPKEIRGQYNYKVQPYLDEARDEITIRIDYDTGERKIFQIRNIIEKIKALNLYDTKEIVPWVTPRMIKRRIAEISKTPHEIEENIFLYTGDKHEHAEWYKDILQHPAYEGERQENKENSKVVFSKRNLQILEDYLVHNKTQQEIADGLSISRVRVHQIIKKEKNQMNKNMQLYKIMDALKKEDK